MVRLMSRFGVQVALFALLAIPAAAQEADVTGEWAITFPNPQGGSATIDAVFVQEGQKVTGTVTIPQVEAEMSEGVVEEAKFSFQVQVNFQGEWYTLAFSGAVDGDAMEGTVDIPDGTRVDFTAMRKEGG